VSEQQTKQSALTFKSISSIVVVILAIGMFITPPPDGISQSIMRAGGLTLFTIGFWTTSIWPIGLTAIAFFFIAALFSIQPVAVIFSGFSSPALWLVFGGLAIGALKGSNGNEKNLDAVFQIAHDIKGQGGSFNYDLMTIIGDMLCRYIEGLKGKSSQLANDVIELHINALHAVISQELKGNGGPVGNQLLSGLELVIKKRTRLG
jgi:hypothetical protein